MGRNPSRAIPSGEGEDADAVDARAVERLRDRDGVVETSRIHRRLDMEPPLGQPLAGREGCRGHDVEVARVRRQVVRRAPGACRA
jgi:hypothetical protein